MTFLKTNGSPAYQVLFLSSARLAGPEGSVCRKQELLYPPYFLAPPGLVRPPSCFCFPDPGWGARTQELSSPFTADPLWTHGHSASAPSQSVGNKPAAPQPDGFAPHPCSRVGVLQVGGAEHASCRRRFRSQPYHLATVWAWVNNLACSASLSPSVEWDHRVPSPQGLTVRE